MRRPVNVLFYACSVSRHALIAMDACRSNGSAWSSILNNVFSQVRQWSNHFDRFHDKTAVGVAILIPRMFQIRLEECPGMADYISEIRNIHEELKDIGITFPEQASAAGLLVGLTPAYSVTSSMLKQLPTKELTFEKVASALLSAEKDLAAQASINAVRYSPGIPFRSQQGQRRNSFPPCQYLYGSRFLLQTDHQALQWLMTAKDLTRKLARWSLLLQEYDFTVSYRPGETRRNVDALSRMHQGLHQQSGGEALSYAHSPPLSPTSNPIPMFTNLFPRSPPPPPAGEGSNSSVDEEGDGGDSGGEEDGDEVDGRNPEEMSSNTEKRDGEEEGEVGKDGSEESDDGDGKEGSGEEGDETDESGEEEEGEEDSEDEKGEEDSEDRDEEMVAPGVGGQENDLEGSKERRSTPPMTQPLKKVRWDKGKLKEEVGTSNGDEKEAGRGRPPHGTQEGEQPGKSLASEITTLDIWEDLHTLFYLDCGDVDPTWDATEKRRVRARGKKFELRDGVLWNLKTKGDKKPVPRKEEREEIISLLHGLGHLGVQRTTDLVRKQYDWYGMGSDVSAFVRGCPTCIFQKGSWTAKGELRPVPVTKPWDRVVIDFVGPLPVTEKGGNRYIISAMDHFTKWPECKAVRHAESATAATFVAEKIISTHGCPLVIHTDNGQHFHGEFGVLLEKFGIYHEFSRPNHPQSSGLIERFQRTLKGALMRLGETNPFEWDENICWVLLGYWASIHSSTKFSHFFLLYGRHPNITGSTLTEWEVKELTDLSTEEEADAAAGFIYERSAEMDLALAKAAENHDKAQEKQKVDFDRRRTILEPIR
ncbi:unnamed protein product, partial [Closterium sp. NIES-54]